MLLGEGIWDVRPGGHCRSPLSKLLFGSVPHTGWTHSVQGTGSGVDHTVLWGSIQDPTVSRGQHGRVRLVG